MAQLHIKVDSPAMPLSTEFIGFCKAVEHFYYVIALASEPDAGKAAAAWRAWLSGGLNPAVRTAPPVAMTDRIRVDSHPGIGGFELTLAGAGGAALARLQTLLRAIDEVREMLAPNCADDVRLASLMEASLVRRELIEPVKAEAGRLSADEADSFLAMIRRGLLALTENDITSIALTLT
jgi:hypothetical protein